MSERTMGTDNRAGSRTWKDMKHLAPLLTFLVFVGCTEDRIVVLTDMPDMPTSDPGTTEVDLLIVMDNSASMQEEQASLAELLPGLVRSLAEGTLRTGSDVDRTFTPVTSLHVGVVSSDMGTGRAGIPTCDGSSGDDGLLIGVGNTDLDPSCDPTYPTPQILTEPEISDADARTEFALDQTCIAQLGTDGCGFEQQLDAMLKSVTSSANMAYTFRGGSPGNQEANGGFGRDDAVLAILIVTDEDDCSTPESDLYNPSSTRFTGDLNLRCFNFPEAVYPISRYADGLIAGRPAERIVFLPIAGIPVDLEPAGDATPDFDGILDAPAMQELIDPTEPARLMPSCNVPGRGLAFPPRRLVQLAQELDARGAHASVASICQAKFEGAILAFTNAIADAMVGDG